MRIREEDLPLRLVGRIVRPGDLEFLRSLIAENPGASRNQLAHEVCRLWSWNKPNGTPRGVSAKLLLLKLHDSGLLKLPPEPQNRRGVKRPRTPSNPAHYPKLTPTVKKQVRSIRTQLSHLTNRPNYAVLANNLFLRT